MSKFIKHPTAKVVLDTRFKKANEKYPVRLRVTYLRVQKYFGLDIELNEEEFSNCINNRTRKELKEIAQKVSKAEVEANEVIKKLVDFNFEKFEAAYFKGISTDKMKVYDLFDEYIGKLKNKGRIGTAISYGNALNSFKAYKRDLKFFEVTPDFLEEYENYMIREGKSKTTVGIYTRSLRVIINEAIAKNIIPLEYYPFGKRKYQIPSSKNEKKALDINQVASIFEYKDFKSESEEKYLAAWKFSYLCNGMNINDFCRLKEENISEDRITFVRRKTVNTKKSSQKNIVCLITPEVRSIILKWGKLTGNPDNYIFPILTPEMSPEKEKSVIHQFIKMVNLYIGRLSQKLDINKHVTTYTARHSFSTVLKRGGAPTEYIQECLGHDSIQTTEYYLDSFEDDTKLNFTALLTKF